MDSQPTNRKVLVVDDDTSFTSDLKMWLIREGFHVHVANVGQAAIQFYRMYRPYEAILLDLHMPKIDGFEVLQQIKRIDIGARVVVLTADATERDRVSGLGADAFLVKPVGRKAICDIIRRLVTTTLS